MSSFRIPRREVEARILLEGGEEVAGRLFAPRHGPHGERGTIEDRLSDAREPFLPLVREGDTLFVSADWILSVTLPAEDAHLAEGDDAHTFELTLRLAGGSEIRGTVGISLPPEESRPLDFLNAAPRFIAVRSESAVVLVNRAFVVSASETDRSA
ncbi:MAG: hypothetical protein R3244_05910 [Thermoanaerobaculia bacterium]|nr:hypothetical protein [Thermoanaerobaculia bacterium]